MIKRHLWVVEWRDPENPRYGGKINKRWECGGPNDTFVTKKEALKQAAEGRLWSGLEYRVTKYVPYEKKYIGY